MLFPFKYTRGTLDVQSKGKKLQYTLKDPQGSTLDTRKTDREYVAAITIRTGTSIGRTFFFGRADLIGKADSKVAIDSAIGKGQEVILCVTAELTEVLKNRLPFTCIYCNEPHSDRLICDEQIRSLGTI